MWNESDPNTPLVCFLALGADPTTSIESLAKAKEFSNYQKHINFAKTDCSIFYIFVRSIEVDIDGPGARNPSEKVAARLHANRRLAAFAKLPLIATFLRRSHGRSFWKPFHQCQFPCVDYDGVPSAVSHRLAPSNIKSFMFNRSFLFFSFSLHRCRSSSRTSHHKESKPAWKGRTIASIKIFLNTRMRLNGSRCCTLLHFCIRLSLSVSLAAFFQKLLILFK